MKNSSQSHPFDGIDTLLQGFNRSVQRTPNAQFLGTRSQSLPGKPYIWKTWKEIDTMTDHLAKGYIHYKLVNESPLGSNQLPIIGICAPNCEEWVSCMISHVKHSIITIGISHQASKDKISEIINHTSFKTLQCSSNIVPTIVLLKQENKIPSLKNVVIIKNDTEPVHQDILKGALDSGLNVLTLEEVVQAGKTNENHALQQPSKDSKFTFIYTSGTTGQAKAVMLTHLNFLSQLRAGYDAGRNISATDTHLSFMSLSHGGDRTQVLYCILGGAKIGFTSGNAKNVFDDARALKPTTFYAVPRILQTLNDQIMGMEQQLNPWQSSLYTIATKYKLRNLRINHKYTAQAFDRLAIYQNIRNLLGGKVRLFLTGAASIEPEILLKMKISFSCPVQLAYGLTEAGGLVGTTNAREFGQDDLLFPLNHVQLQVKEVPDIFTQPSNEETNGGELYVKGPSVMKAYFNNETATKETFDDEGWLKTGDVVKMFKNGSFKIIDRTKNIFKLAQGVYIAPEQLEGIYQQSPFVKQILVNGDGSRTYLVALVVLEDDYVNAWLEKSGLPKNTVHEHLKSENLVNAVLSDLERLSLKYGLTKLEWIKKVLLTDQAFSTTDGLLTDSLKIKRKMAYQRYQNEFDQLYKEPKMV